MEHDGRERTGIERRRALQFLGGALALPVLARVGGDDVFAAGRAVHAGLDMGDGAYIFRSLDANQKRAVMAIVDQIIPETDTPGALAANVHEFIDLLLSEFVDPETRSRFLKGLAELDQRSHREHARAFADCDAAQQLALLEALQAEANAQAAAAGAPAGFDWGRRSASDELFLHQVKGLTLWGYYTSEIGMTQERPYNLIPGWQPGCEPF